VASESSIQENILDYINSLRYGRAENVSGNAKQSGRADINACINGITFKIEVKTEDTRYGREGATTKQRLYLEKWAKAGAVACVVYSVDDVKYCIRLRTPSMIPSVDNLQLSGRGKWYDVQNKRWVDISY
jgi:hypothetical protein